MQWAILWFTTYTRVHNNKGEVLFDDVCILTKMVYFGVCGYYVLSTIIHIIPANGCPKAGDLH